MVPLWCRPLQNHYSIAPLACVYTSLLNNIHDFSTHNRLTVRNHDDIDFGNERPHITITLQTNEVYIK